MISRKYKFHVLKRKIADFFNSQKFQYSASQLFYLGSNVKFDNLLRP